MEAGFGFARLVAGRAGRFGAPLSAAPKPLGALAVADLLSATFEAAVRARAVAGLLAAGVELLEDCLAGADLVDAGAALRCAEAERDGVALLRDASACAAAFST